MPPRVGNIRPSGQAISPINVRADASAFGAGIGRALSELGQVAEGIAEEHQVRESKKNRFAALTEMTKMLDGLDMDIAEAERSAELGAPEHTNSIDTMIEERYAQFRQNISHMDEDLRAEMDFRLEAPRSKFTFNAFKFQRDSEDKFVETEFLSQLNIAQTAVHNNPNMLELEQDRLAELLQSTPLPATVQQELALNARVALQESSYEGHISSSFEFGPRGELPNTIAAKDLPEVSALFLNLTGSVEGAYDVRFDGTGTGTKFADFSKHPNVAAVIPKGFARAGEKSTAAGRYQFIFPTWERARKALDLPDFSPESQDKAAWWLAKKDYAKRNNGADLEEALVSGDAKTLAQVRKSMTRTWEGFGKLTDEEFAAAFVKPAMQAQATAGLRPLKAGEFRVNADGTHSTELPITVEVDGEQVFIPSLWMGPGGPVEFPDAASATRAALDYEARTGKRFPRFASVEEANAFAPDRSINGGVLEGPLAQEPTEADIEAARQAPDIFNDPQYVDIPYNRKVILAAKMKREGDARRAEAQTSFINGDGKDYDDFLVFVRNTGTIPEGTRFTPEGFRTVFDPNEAATFSAEVTQALEEGRRNQALKGATPAEVVAMGADLAAKAAEAGDDTDDFRLLNDFTSAVQQRNLAIQRDSAAYVFATDEAVQEATADLAETDANDAAAMKAATAKQIAASTAAQVRIGVAPENVRILDKATAAGLVQKVVTLAADPATSADAGGVLAAQLEVYGDNAQQLLEELDEAKLPPALYYSALHRDNPALSQEFAALADPSNDPATLIPKGDLNLIREQVAAEFDAFESVFRAGDFTGAATSRIVEQRALAEKVVQLRLLSPSKPSIEEATTSVFQEMIADNYTILDGSGRLSAFVPREVGDTAINPQMVENAAEFLLTPEQIDTLDPVGFLFTADEVADKELTRQHLLSSAKWVTNSSSTGLLLVTEFGTGQPLPVLRRPQTEEEREMFPEGLPLERSFIELQAMNVAAPEQPGVFDETAVP